jgi:DeoR family transcriptional regulator, fructose operon transcriptional repressor
MIRFERKRVIIELLGKSEVAYIADLAQATGASDSTVRRDIDELVKEGEVVALRGGAVRLNQRMTELPTAVKALINKDEKTAIAAAAARQVNDGETIYIDAGTTALQMIPFLTGLDLHIVTSNTHLLTLLPDPGIGITVLAGDYLANTGSIVGSLTEDLLRRMFFDKAFIGASGVSARAGVNTFDVREAMKKQIVHANSTESYVLVDHTKIGKSSLHQALNLSETVIVTDTYHELLASAKDYILPEPEALTGS